MNFDRDMSATVLKLQKRIKQLEKSLEEHSLMLSNELQLNETLIKKVEELEKSLHEKSVMLENQHLVHKELLHDEGNMIRWAGENGWSYLPSVQLWKHKHHSGFTTTEQIKDYYLAYLVCILKSEPL